MRWEGSSSVRAVLARPAGFEPATCRLGTDCSILLSYGRSEGQGSALARWSPAARRSETRRGLPVDRHELRVQESVGASLSRWALLSLAQAR